MKKSNQDIKIEWCRNWIISTFRKYDSIECNCLWRMAERAGLYIPNTYGAPMSKALVELADVQPRYNSHGDWMYNTFVLKH